MSRSGCSCGWFVVRRGLSRGRRGLLAVLSFVLPLLLWGVVSSVPGIWHPDVKLTLAAGTERMTAVFTAGNRVSKEFFPQYAEAVRRDNEDIAKGGEPQAPAAGAKRANRLLLRQLATIHERVEDDYAVVELDLTQGTLAQMLGASREAVNKQLRALAKDGRIAVEGHEIRVMKQAKG